MRNEIKTIKSLRLDERGLNPYSNGICAMSGRGLYLNLNLYWKS